MTKTLPYPIGEENKPWGAIEKAKWLSRQTIQRHYKADVLDKLVTLGEDFELVHYGSLAYDPNRYPLWAATSKSWESGKPVALVTGGVHGYETSGVLGALRFLSDHAAHYAQHFNIIVAPCVSPWGYETINRWNPYAVDPNRSFKETGDAQEALELMKFVRSKTDSIRVHIELHETTDSDNSEFRPALSARDNVHQEIWDIPDGFYLVGNKERPNDAFQKHIITAVSQHTHIAEADAQGKIIGEPTSQVGVINYATKALGLCAGFTDADFSTTTEVYPDSPKVSPENCIRAQVAAVTGALDFVKSAS